jgi:sec-independent protein translocase protein TatC
MSPQADNHEPEEQLAEGTLMSHLLELRSRIMKATFAVVVVFLALTPFTQRVFEVVSAPLIAVLPAGSEMIATDVAAPFVTPFKTTFFVALFIAMPVVIFQVWQFVAPGLYKREKKFAIPLIISSVVLFYTGMAFAYFVVFRLMFSFFANVVPGGVQMAPDISSYLSFVLGIFLAFGVAFEVPIATVMLIWSGLVSM